jgi:predicted permease
MHVLNSLMPVFLIVALGKLLCRSSFFTPDLVKDLNRITYWIALPALLFAEISSAEFDGGEVGRITLLLIVCTLGSFLVGGIAARVLRLPHRALGAFIQGCGRANNAFIGLPVIVYALSDAFPGVKTIATVALGPAIVFYNVSSIAILLLFGERRPVGAASHIFFRQLLLNPMILACLAGLLVNASGTHPPLMVGRTMAALGQAALPLALLCIGSSLTIEKSPAALLPALVASVIKVLIQPLSGLLLGRLWGLSALELSVLLIYLACPTATASYVLAERFGSDAALASRIIVISTLLSILSLSLAVALQP